MTDELEDLQGSLTCPSGPDPHLFPPGGDMLDYLVQEGEISQPDGLLASWFHRANSKEQMNHALSSDVMILEADVTLRGYGTPSQEPVPIMAHPPDIQSDNTLDEWLDAVLASRKAMKLDFKALDSVGFSLDLLRQKNSSGRINRPVWLNADVLIGPNTPAFMPTVNGSRFLQLVQEKFPDATLSPGWMVSYAPPLFTSSYTRAMVEDMYDLVKDCPQKVTFPVHALLVRSGWQHLSWLLSQSPRFSLTLWQGSIHPNVSDLLFVRDNSHPARVYYDIYEPTLSQFKEAAARRTETRKFYPGGNLMDFLHHTHTSHSYTTTTTTQHSNTTTTTTQHSNTTTTTTQHNSTTTTTTQHNSLDVHWFTVTDQESLLPLLSGGGGGMLVVGVSSDSSTPGLPVVQGPGSGSGPGSGPGSGSGSGPGSGPSSGSGPGPGPGSGSGSGSGPGPGSGSGSELFSLQDVLELLGQNPEARWGIYLQIRSPELLEACLLLLQSFYSSEDLFRPVWIGMESSQNSQDWVSSVEKLFPAVTVVLPLQHHGPGVPAAAAGVSQRVELQHHGPGVPAAAAGVSQQVELQHHGPGVPAAAAGVSQRVALRLNAASLPTGQEELNSLMEHVMNTYDLLLELDSQNHHEDLSVINMLKTHKTGRGNTYMYVI